jgi:hypothetical protein
MRDAACTPGQNEARIVNSGEDQDAPHNQHLAPAPLTAFGKYAIALPYVIAPKTRVPQISHHSPSSEGLRLMLINATNRRPRAMSGMGLTGHRTYTASRDP